MAALRIQRLMYVVGFLGWCSDRWGRRPLLLLGLALSAVGYIVLGASDSIVVMVVSRVITGIFKHSNMLCKAVLADVTAPRDRPRVLGTFNGAMGLAFIVGPAAGGHMTVLENGFSLVCYIAAGLFTLNFVLCLVLLPAVLPAPPQPKGVHSIQNQPQLSAKDQSFEEQLANGQQGLGLSDQSYLSQQLILGESEEEYTQQFVQKEKMSIKEQSNPGQCDKKLTQDETLFQIFHFMKDIDWQKFGDIFMIEFFITFATFAYRSSFVLLIDQMFDAGPKIIGYIISFQGIVGALAGFLTGKVSLFYDDPTLELFHSSVLQVLSLLGLTLAPTVSLVIVLLIPLSISDTILHTSVSTVLIDRCDPSKIGSVTGFGQCIPAVARMTTPILAGLAQEVSVFGPGIMATVSAGIGATLAGYMAKRRKPKDD
nr:major facilitator superfamily domain-containing protein 9-like isoform X2 [Procambarus clarkii]